MYVTHSEYAMANVVIFKSAAVLKFLKARNKEGLKLKSINPSNIISLEDYSTTPRTTLQSIQWQAKHVFFLISILRKDFNLKASTHQKQFLWKINQHFRIFIGK